MPFRCSLEESGERLAESDSIEYLIASPLGNRMIRLLLLLVLSLSGLFIQAGDLPIAIRAKFMKVVASNIPACGGKVAVRDSDMADALLDNSLDLSPKSILAWATSAEELSEYVSAKKVVVVGQLDWLKRGACIAIVEEGGKPCIYISKERVAATGVTLSESLMKVGKFI